jgi:hypothetical protein
MKIFEVTLAEETTGKLTDVKPGAEATVDMGDGTKTVIDLKKNPTALVKSPDGKIMMNKAGITSGGVQPETPDPASMMKPGEPVFVTDKTMEDEESIKTIRGPHGRLNVNKSKGITRVTRSNYSSGDDKEDDGEPKIRGRKKGRKAQPDHRSIGLSGGVGVPQRSSFSDVHSDFMANRKRPYLDYDDDEILETDKDRRKFLGLGAAGALASLGTGAGLGHLYVSNEIDKKRSHLEKQKRIADKYMDMAEFAIESQNIKAACKYFEKAQKTYIEAGLVNYAKEVQSIIDTCRARGF